MKILYCLVTILFAIGCVTSKCAKSIVFEEPLTPSQQFFSSIPQNSRESFIRYFLREGLRELTGHDVVSKDVTVELQNEEFGNPPEEFASNLVGWTRNAFGIHDEQIVRLVEDGSVYTTDTTMISPTDIGCHCCPF